MQSFEVVYLFCLWVYGKTYIWKIFTQKWRYDDNVEFNLH